MTEERVCETGEDFQESSRENGKSGKKKGKSWNQCVLERLAAGKRGGGLKTSY